MERFYIIKFKKNIMKIILSMHIIKKVIKIKKKVKNHQNIENQKFTKPALKIPNALNYII